MTSVGIDALAGSDQALAIEQELRERGIAADFRATGQTGILIAGSGIAIDAVVSDFISGAAEALSPDNDPDHWDVIEGQGSLLHPSYAGVTLGLIHGSQPDAVVLCHDAGREEILGLEGSFPVPPIEKVIGMVLLAARTTNPDCFCAGISVNTSAMNDDERTAFLTNLEKRYALPCADPIATGMSDIADHLLENSK